jgi:hypothetical protein
MRKKATLNIARGLAVVTLVGGLLTGVFWIGWWCSKVEQRLTKVEGKVDLLLGTKQVAQWTVEGTTDAAD